MAIQILIDQAGKPAGVAGQAREDLALGVAVVLTAVNGVGVTEYQWTIVGKPPNEAMTLESAAVLSAPAAVVTALTPDFDGTYLVEVLVDQGFGLGERDEDKARITFYAGAALAVDPSGWPRRAPAYNEQREHNAPDTISPAGNPNGWARELERWKRAIARAWRLVTSSGDGRINAFPFGVPGFPSYRFFFSTGYTAGGVWGTINSTLATLGIDNSVIPWSKMEGQGTVAEILEPCGWVHPGGVDHLGNVLTRLVYNAGGPLTFYLEVDAQAIYYFQGIRTSAQPVNVEWPDVSGFHFFYLDGAGALRTTQDPDLWISVLTGRSGTPVAGLYWNAAANAVVAVLDERHGQMPGSVHVWAHRGIGALWVSGGALTNFTFGNGSIDSHAQLGVGNVTIQDEDIVVSAIDGAPATPNMDPTLTCRVMAKVGTEWVIKTPDAFPFMQSGAFYSGGGYVGAAGRVAYNLITAGVGSLPELTQGNYVLVHILVSTDATAGTTGTNWRVFAVVGQNQYLTAAAARAGARKERHTIELDGLPVQEVVWLGSAILQSSTAYANSVMARFQQAEDETGALVPYIDWRTPRSGVGGVAGGVSDHGLLGGLADNDHPQYLLATEQAALDQLSFWNEWRGRAEVTTSDAVVPADLRDWTPPVLLTVAQVGATYTLTGAGGAVADRYIEKAATNFVAGSTTVIEFDALAGTRFWILVSVGSTANGAAWFDLSLGALGTLSGAGIINRSITDAGGGYWRIKLLVRSGTNNTRIWVVDGDLDTQTDLSAAVNVTIRGFKYRQPRILGAGNRGALPRTSLVQATGTKQPAFFDPVNNDIEGALAGLFFNDTSSVRYLEIKDDAGAFEWISQAGVPGMSIAFWMVASAQDLADASNKYALHIAGTVPATHYTTFCVVGANWTLRKKESNAAADVQSAVAIPLPNVLYVMAGYVYHVGGRTFINTRVAGTVGPPAEIAPGLPVTVSEVTFGGGTVPLTTGGTNHLKCTVRGAYLAVGKNVVPGDAFDLAVLARCARVHGVAV